MIFLLVIFAPRINHKSPVNLFAENYPHKLMRKSHIGKRQFIIRRILYALRQAAGRTYYKSYLPPSVAQLFYFGSQSLAGQLNALHTERKYITF